MISIRDENLISLAQHINENSILVGACQNENEKHVTSKY